MRWQIRATRIILKGREAGGGFLKGKMLCWDCGRRERDPTTVLLFFPLFLRGGGGLGEALLLMDCGLAKKEGTRRGKGKE